MTRPFLTLGLLILPVTLAVTLTVTLSGAQAPPQGPILRASVDQVVVDVVVTDADGAIVPGLTAADFELIERGQPQTVATFTEVSLPLVKRGTGMAPPSPGDVRSNRRAADARIYILLLDDANVSLLLTPTVHSAARRFVQRYVQPGDLVAVLTSTGLGVTRQEPTEDMALVDAAISRFVGKGGDVVSQASEQRAAQAYATRNANPMTTTRRSTTTIDDGSVADNEDSADEGRERARLSLRTLEYVADSVAGVPGRRKTILFFSEGAPDTGRDSEFNDLQSRVLAAAARANVTIYSLDPKGLWHDSTSDPRGLEAVPGSLDPTAVQRSRDVSGRGTAGAATQRRIMAAAMLRRLAEGSGGVATIDQTNLEPALDRVASDASHYYLLGYVPTDTKRDGRYRSIEVKVKKPGLTVSARKGYVEPDDKALRRAAEARAKGNTGPLADLIRRPVGTTGMPLAVHAVAFPMPSNNVRVVVEVGAGALDATSPTDADVVELAIVPVEPGGKVLPAIEGKAKLAIPGADAATLRERGLRMVHRLTLAPGRYQLRVAARETMRGTSGSVIYDLEVPAPPTGLVISPLLISSAHAGRMPTAERDTGLEQALGGRPPTAARVFTTDDVISAYAEVIEAGKGEPRDVELTTLVRDGRGRDLVKSPQPRANAGVAQGMPFPYAIDIPLKSLTPGRYTLRVEARATGSDAVAARDVIFEVKGVTP
jgi:VWFA-related protein